jgi:hypothetical protein
MPAESSSALHKHYCTLVGNSLQWVRHQAMRNAATSFSSRAMTEEQLATNNIQQQDCNLYLISKPKLLAPLLATQLKIVAAGMSNVTCSMHVIMQKNQVKDLQAADMFPASIDTKAPPDLNSSITLLKGHSVDCQSWWSKVLVSWPPPACYPS